jgi:hypothetical protein
MNRRMWIGILTGVVAAMVVLGVAGAAFKGDDDHDEVTRTVPVGGTGEVRVVGDDDRDEEHKGFFLLPLLLIPLVVLGVAAARGGFGNGHHGRDASFEEQHRRAHEHANAVRPGPAPQPAPEPGPEPEAKM